MSLTPGSCVGVYEIVARLGAGGIGEVYRARDPNLRRQVAVKVLSPAFASDPERLSRFEREAVALAALSHPNILAIHDLGRDGDLTYAVMELLNGHSLREVLDAGPPLQRWRTMGCATQIAQALEAAHARGIVHRDLKPENVFVSAANHVKILDFGLAATPAGAVMNTPGYLSPEQVRGETVDARTDIFSFGCVLYEMLCRKRAFHGPSSDETVHAILHSDPPNLATLSHASEPLGRIVARCLEKAPDARFQRASDIVLALSGAA
jgi:serine/threonine protein kinase